MRTYLTKRLLLVPITLLGITFLTFIVLKLAPGDPARALRSQAGGGNLQATQANIEALENWKKERHLDKSIIEQYGFWVRDLCTFNLGRSLTSGRRSVWEMIVEALPVTLIINLISFVLIYLVAIPIGIIGAAKQFTLWDRVLTVSVFLLYSLPSFWVGTLMIAYLTGQDGLPTTGFHGKTMEELGFLPWIGLWAKHLLLPIVCLTYQGFAFLSRQMRSSLLEQIRQDFVRTARAKGLSERVVLLRHATRNALIPVITLLGTLLPSLIGGSVIIEQLFSIPGMGQLFFECVLRRDYNVIMGIEVLTALLTLVGMLLSDILYVVVNPTIRYE